MNITAPYLLAFFFVYFFVCFVWRRVIQWRATGINPVVIPRGDSTAAYVGRGFKLSLAILLLDLSITSIWPSLHVAWALNLPRSVGLQALGIALLVTSLLICAIAQIQMGTSWRIGIDKSPTRLIQHGLFRFSRNPIFLSMRLSLLGLLLIWLTPLSFAAAIVGEMSMQIQVRLEEEHLKDLHHDAYVQYQSKVRRWL